MSAPLNFTTTALTLSAGATTLAINRNNERQYLFIENTGTGLLSIGFASGTLSAGTGPTLGAASGAGGQGGSFEWKSPGPVHTGSIYLYSGAGTTAVVTEG